MLHVVLVRPLIPGNVGTIGRTCLSFGCALHLVGPLGFSLDEKKVRRAGLDYWKHVDLRTYDDWSEFESAVSLAVAAVLVLVLVLVVIPLVGDPSLMIWLWCLETRPRV
eukprot:TRINITY_DN194_c0_g2_i6.p2 TRINITY_DN194_c0_g2~~TRINITY_DN194_c0_g2_i6.p2  ORF type:complete len:109 (+),score=10.25 TRINITY_DN194_c0_g2_i6:194-520(+)